MAEVVPLRGRVHADRPTAPTEVFLDAGDAASALEVRWQQAARSVELTLGARDGEECPTTFRLDAEDVLDLVRVLVEGLSEPGPVRLGGPATVLPLTPRHLPR